MLDAVFEPGGRFLVQEHVLVVEPASEQCAFVQGCLERAGYRVSIAGAGEPALRVFEQSPADVVFLDVLAPSFDGFATCKRLRELPAGPRAAIVCLTSDDPISEHRAFESGADDCLATPLHDFELLLRVRSILRWKRTSERQQRALDELRAERDALLLRARQRDETMALLVHDMKNPLAGVISNAEYLITSKGLSSDQHDCARDIVSASRRLHRLVSSMLDVNLREHGVLVPAISCFDLAELVEQAIAQVGSSLAEKSLECRRAGVTRPLTIRADRDMLARLLTNLLDNAVRSSVQRGHIEVELRQGRPAAGQGPQPPISGAPALSGAAAPAGASSAADSGMNWIEIRVSDRGPSLPSGHRERVFDTYLHDEAMRRFRRGRGLGLASCRAIAEAHGGTIEIEDRQPTGSTFRVCLPVAPVVPESHSAA